MKRMLSVTTLCLGAVAMPAIAAPTYLPAIPAHHATAHMLQDAPGVLLVKNDKAKGPKRLLKKNETAPGKSAGKATGKPKTGGKAPKKAAKAVDKRKDGATEKTREAVDDTRFVRRATQTEQARDALVDTFRGVAAPEGRDMTNILGAASLALLGREVVVQDLPERELLTYRNCPPGLAKKDPPCVPPGLAKAGVGYDEWVSYDRDGYARLLDDRRVALFGEDAYSDRDGFSYEPGFLLRSDDIARLYGLDPAASGQRYALIDGLPVLVNETDYDTLARISDLARIADTGDAVRVSPTAALTQDELRRLYRLPDPGDGYNYTVLNGEVLRLDDDSYGILQLMRVARAVL